MEENDECTGCTFIIFNTGCVKEEQEGLAVASIAQDVVV